MSLRMARAGLNQMCNWLSEQSVQGVLSSTCRTSSWWSHFQQLLWPAHCLICRCYLGGKACCELAGECEGSNRLHAAYGRTKEVEAESVQIGPSLVCGRCRLQMPGFNDEQCYQCGSSVGPGPVGCHRAIPGRCSRCRAERWNPDCVMRLLIYRGLARRACLSCKTAAGEQLTSELSRLLVARHRELLAARRPDLVVPVPAYWLRRFCQHDHPSEVMARTISRLMGTRLATGLIVRVRKGRRQKRLSTRERQANVEGQYRVVRSRGLVGASILLVDDIVTSGATVNEVARLLRKNGACRIDVATLARGLPARSRWKSTADVQDSPAQTANSPPGSS